MATQYFNKWVQLLLIITFFPAAEILSFSIFDIISVGESSDIFVSLKLMNIHDDFPMINYKKKTRFLMYV